MLPELIESESVIRKPERVLPQNYYLKLGSVPIAVNQVLRVEDLSSEFVMRALRPPETGVRRA
jgi:hypothetical protein